jgi:hypothetical protein
VAGKERGVKVEAAVLRDTEYRSGQYLPIGADDDYVRTKGSQLHMNLRALKATGLDDANPQRQGLFFDRGHAERHAAPSRPVYLGVYGCQFVTFLDKIAQGRQGKLGATHEDQPHAAIIAARMTINNLRCAYVHRHNTEKQ